MLDIIGMAKFHGVHLSPNFTIKVRIDGSPNNDLDIVDVDNAVMKLSELSLVYSIRDINYGRGSITFHMSGSKDMTTNICVELLDVIIGLFGGSYG